MFEKLYIAIVALLDRIIWTIDVGPSVHKFFLSPQVGNFRVGLGKVRAVRLYRRAAKRVPAYRQHLEQHAHRGPHVGLRKTTLGDVPEMDKASYIKQYPLLDKLWNGRLPATGVMFDESSGSSGTPTSWVRGRKERRFTQRIMQVAFKQYIQDRQPIMINTFSMGAWATGLNTTLSLLGVARVKSTGPDIIKVIDTLKELGPDFDYVITGYPPFLKLVTDSPEIDWSKYRITAIYGGEGISESMRSQLLEYYQEVIGSYGASDLEINIAHENPFTIALRRALAEDVELRQDLMIENRGIIPMVFQYNPYDYLFETNEKGELLVTICRLENLSPRIRYNIHDLGHAEDFYKLKKKLKAHGRTDLLELAELDFGVLFHYGRSDLSVDYNGAVVGPEEVKQILNATKQLTSLISAFRLISYEDAKAHKHLMIAIELHAGKSLGAEDQHDLLEHLIAELKTMNLDFKSAISTAAFKPEIKVYEAQTGIFDTAHQKLKNDYVWNIDFARAKHEGIVD
ncbi:MAG: CoF synthetase [Candidatus Saccharibacteria bacterium]|nr:CoF synthetase [Candidatus Saccharibacteria bacterium]